MLIHLAWFKQQEPTSTPCFTWTNYCLSQIFWHGISKHDICVSNLLEMWTWRQKVKSRAKVSLLRARYEDRHCCTYVSKSYPNLKWNKVDKKWEIEPGITIDQLSEESRKVFEKTSELRKLLKPSKKSRNWSLSHDFQ